jgi:hypothetical protein
MVSNNNHEDFNGQQYLSKYTLAQGVAFSILTFDEVAHTSGHPTLEHYEVNCHHHEFPVVLPSIGWPIQKQTLYDEDHTHGARLKRVGSLISSLKPSLRM